MIANLIVMLFTLLSSPASLGMGGAGGGDLRSAPLPVPSEQSSLRLDHFHRCGTFRIIVRRMIDPLLTG